MHGFSEVIFKISVVYFEITSIDMNMTKQTAFIYQYILTTTHKTNSKHLRLFVLPEAIFKISAMENF